MSDGKIDNKAMEVGVLSLASDLVRDRRAEW